MKYIEISPERRGGLPVIVGTRYTIEQLLAELAENANPSDIAERFNLNLSIICGVLAELSLTINQLLISAKNLKLD